MRIEWRNVRLIFLRELRDQLRDRRTLFMVAVLPLLLYPALGIGMLQLTTLFTEQKRTVVILGANELPQKEWLDEQGIDRRWFSNSLDADKLIVVTDHGLAPPADASQGTWRALASDHPGTASTVASDTAQGGSRTPTEAADRIRLLNKALRIRNRLPELQKHETLADEAAAVWKKSLQQPGESSQPEGSARDIPSVQVAEQKYRTLHELVQVTRKEISELLSSSNIHMLVIIPPEFHGAVTVLSQKLSAGERPESGEFEYPRPKLVYNRADEKSVITYNRVHDSLNNWEADLMHRRLAAAKLPEHFTRPIHAEAVNVELDEQRSANMWSKLFPALLIIMSVTGAFYPAIDLCAGEKERGTMETLLICPASRPEIVLGKFLTVLSFSIATTLLNFVSMGLTSRHMASMAPSGQFSGIDVSLPHPIALMWMVVLLIPLSTLFSALCLALATFARSSKEGQYYLTPLLMVTMGLTVFCMSPGVELTPIYSVTPVVGPALLLKAQLLGSLPPFPLFFYCVTVLSTSIGYGALALWWAIDQFNREDVLFREAERFEFGLWLRHLLRDKEEVPTFGEAVFCFILIMFLQFGVMSVFQRALDTTPDRQVFVMLQLLMVQQLALVATPALFMGVMLTTSFRQTFRLYRPDWVILGAAVGLPFVLHPLSVELLGSLSWFFPELPESVRRVLALMKSHEQPLWLTLLAFAALPALCEEIAFRGFILNGFARRGRYGLAIVLSALAFGAMHVIPMQVFNASLMGLVLGLIAIRGKSLPACIAFHFVNNFLAVMHGRIGSGVAQGVAETLPRGLATALFYLDEAGQLRYGWLLLLLCLGIASTTLAWLYRRPNAQREPTLTRPAPGQTPFVNGVNSTGTSS